MTATIDLALTQKQIRILLCGHLGSLVQVLGLRGLPRLRAVFRQIAEMDALWNGFEALAVQIEEEVLTPSLPNVDESEN